MDEKQFIVIDEEGNEFLCEIIFTFHSDDFDRDYVVYAIPGEADDDEIEVSAAWYKQDGDDEGELFPIETDEERELVEQVLEQFEDELQEETIDLDDVDA